MMFALDIGLGKQLDRLFSHLKRRQWGYSFSAKLFSFIQMIIKGGDRLSDIDLLRADPGLLNLLWMESVPRPNTLSDLALRFSKRDIHRLAKCEMMLVVLVVQAKKLRRLIHLRRLQHRIFPVPFLNQFLRGPQNRRTCPSPHFLPTHLAAF